MDNKHSIAVALIVRNESENLKACLKTVNTWADEIVILDSGSSDNTETIARQFTDKFYTNSDWPGFGKQRQIAQTYVESDYILWLDADERVTPELQASIQNILNQDEISNTIYRIPRLSWVFGRYIRHCGWYPDKVIRFYPTKLTHYNDALVHEKVIQPDGINMHDLSGDAIHYTYNDIHHYLVKSAGYAKAWADQREAKGKSATLFQGVSHALGCFIKMYLLKAGFLDGKQGFLLSILSAHSTFVKYADLWERSQQKSSE